MPYSVRTFSLPVVYNTQGIAVAPYLLTGGTDSKHFSHLTRAIYRFVPYSGYLACKSLLLPVQLKDLGKLWHNNKCQAPVFKMLQIN
eukprot:1141262-Pelagomonas_calceolata.AAC.9